jgi:hypothetical protein
MRSESPPSEFHESCELEMEGIDRVPAVPPWLDSASAHPSLRAKLLLAT